MDKLKYECKNKIEVRINIYADDTQIYIHCKPENLNFAGTILKKSFKQWLCGQGRMRCY